MALCRRASYIIIANIEMNVVVVYGHTRKHANKAGSHRIILNVLNSQLHHHDLLNDVP